MNASARFFTGIALSDEARRALSALSLPVEGGTVYDEALYHLTLVFLGDTPLSALKRLEAALERAPKEPFTLALSSLGSFKGGSILWAGVEESAPLRRLQAALTRELGQAGFPCEEGAYTPHITLARRARIVGALPEPPHVRFPVCAVTLFQSHRVDGKLRYTPICESVLP